MSNTVIKVENLSKAYQLGEFSTGTLSNDIQRWWYLMRGKEDPFLKIGETNDRSVKGTSDVVWSLKDINFEIQQGDAVGIIGKNGAGKSTLLKLLSRVTSPTTGSIKVKGRIASLLEVGTGFHPELTGRENIYLNGAILGMRKKEITMKFDEIVAFSGVERYIDTPVKRYSSGMYVRLAFAVAAHLESEILIVDEVLAVGDAEFQKKCLGKMGDVSKGEGRTVLFVSHNMAAVSTLCKVGILLDKGGIKIKEEIKKVIEKYISLGKSSQGEILEKDIAFSCKNEDIIINRIGICNQGGYSNSFGINDDIFCDIEYTITKDKMMIFPSIHLLNKFGDCIFASINSSAANLSFDQYFDKLLTRGTYKVTCIIPKFFLNDTRYSISVFLSPDKNYVDMTSAEEVLTFDVNETGEMRQEHSGTWIGQIRPKLTWNTIKLS